MEMLEEAAHHPTRAWVRAYHEAPGAVPLAAVIEVPTMRSNTHRTDP
jgi:hypothetical protein